MGVKERQLGFSDWEHSRVRRQTRKEKFLRKTEAVLPFSTLVKAASCGMWICKSMGGR